MKNPLLIPLFAAIIGGVITAGVNIYINFRQEDQKLSLQKQQFESELILRAIVPDSLQRSKKNIDLLVKAGFISSRNEIVNKIKANDSLLNIHLGYSGSGGSRSSFASPQDNQLIRTDKIGNPPPRTP